METKIISEELEDYFTTSNLSQEEREVVVVMLTENILKRAMMDLIESLDEEEELLFKHITAQNGAEEAIAWLSATHPELETRMKTITQEVVQEFLLALEK